MCMRSSTRLFAFCTACACWLSATALAQTAPVTARLDPDTIGVDDAATLAITTDGAAIPELPEVAGLSIQPIGTQTSVTVTNGVAVETATYLYSVQAKGPGNYELEGIRAGADSAPKLRLHVQAAGSSPPSAAQAGAAPSADAKLAFMRLRVEDRRIYVGQSVPFTVNAYFRGGTGVTVRGRPQLSSDAFTVSGVDDEPAQQQTTIDGVPYLAVTWRGSLTAAKSGDFPLDMTLPVSMQYREQAQTLPAQPRSKSLRDLFGHFPLGGSPFGAGSPFDSLLNDPFFDSMFDEPLLQGFGQPGHVVNRDLDLHGRAGKAHVEALPSENRPADFAGAVGQFEIEARLAQPTLTQGEPVDMQVTVSGRGNFGQFSLPTLQDDSQWKAYKGHSSFTPADKAGLEGKLELQQPLAALNTGHVSVPPLRFSYFDPKAERYVTKTTTPIPVDVAAAQELASAQAPKSAADADQRDARTDELSVRSLANGGVPAWLLPCAFVLLGLSVSTCALIALRRSRRFAQRAKRTRARRAFTDQLRAMQRAQRGGDRLAYLRAGRAALQARLAAAWGLPPETISVRELDARWPDAPEDIRELLELADQADYGRAGQHSADPKLTLWARGVDKQLSHMEVPS